MSRKEGRCVLSKTEAEEALTVSEVHLPQLTSSAKCVHVCVAVRDMCSSMQQGANAD